MIAFRWFDLLMRILVTGSSGLVGSALCTRLRRDGHEVVQYDIRIQPGLAGHGDILDTWTFSQAANGCDGIVHLAAVSRVVWGESNPYLCHKINVDGTRNALAVARTSIPQPWVLFASSREVYGQQSVFPVVESASTVPVNTYGRSKLAGEQLVTEAVESGSNASTMRLSNVFGSVDDHADRVIPAFAQAAAVGGILRVEGRQSSFDFTPLSDTIDGITRLISLISREGPQPPIHLVTGRETTLGELAELATRLGHSNSQIIERPERKYDVSRFVGDPGQALSRLGWKPSLSLEQALQNLIDEFGRAKQQITSTSEQLAAHPA